MATPGALQLGLLSEQQILSTKLSTPCCTAILTYPCPKACLLFSERNYSNNPGDQK